jgi:hypothetical protein
MSGGAGTHDDAIKILTRQYQYIIDDMIERRDSVYGIITQDMQFQYNGYVPSNLTPIEKNECFAPWHVHISRVVAKPVENVFFSPPSMSDIYYAIFGKCMGKYNYSFIISLEGIYTIDLTNYDVRAIAEELREFLQSDNPWQMPARHAVDEHGDVGFIFDEKESTYPLCHAILTAYIRWDFDDLADAVNKYKVKMNELGINIIFNEYNDDWIVPIPPRQPMRPQQLPRIPPPPPPPQPQPQQPP